jgi:hypothetical protein
MLESTGWLDRVGRSLAIGVAAVTLSSCAVEEQKQPVQLIMVDHPHISVTPEDSRKPYTVLGDVTYTEPYTPEAINEARIKYKLQRMGLAKWPDTLDALVKEKSAVSDDGSTVKVSAVATQYAPSPDPAMLPTRREATIASSSGN